MCSKFGKHCGIFYMKLDIQYLGLPLGGNLLCADFWVLVHTKVTKRLDGWKKASYPEVVVILMHSMFSSLPTFCFSFELTAGQLRLNN